MTASSTRGDVLQQSEIISRGNRSWYTAAVENMGPEARRVEMLGGHTRVSKSVDDGEVEASAAPRTSEDRRQEMGRKHLDMELRGRWRAFAHKQRKKKCASLFLLSLLVPVVQKSKTRIFAKIIGGNPSYRKNIRPKTVLRNLYFVMS